MEKIPVEVLEKVFEFMPWKDRKAGVMVNSKWRAAGEASHLWAWVQLPEVVDQNSREKVIKMLSSPRLARVEEITIDSGAVSEDLLQAMIQHTGLKRIRISPRGAFPAGLDSQLVVEALTRVEDFGGSFFPLPNHLTIALLTEVAEGRSNLKELSLWGTSLTKVPPALLAAALTRLVTINLNGASLTFDQVAALMEGINQGGSSIEKLVLDLPRDGRGIEPLNLQPLVKLEEVTLHFCFNRQELVDFFAALSESTKLKKLWIDGLPDDWPAQEEMDGSTEVMAKAFNFLEKGDMMAYPYQVYLQNFEL